MKTLLIALSASALLAAPALASAPAQAQAAQDKPTAAATLPNAFDGPAPRPSAAPPAATAAADATVDSRSEPALRAIVAAIQAGEPDYDVFSPDLAAKMRDMAPQVTPLVQQFGELKTAAYEGEQNGADMFRLTFDNQATQWLIGFNDAGKVAALLFRPAE